MAAIIFPSTPAPRQSHCSLPLSPGSRQDPPPPQPVCSRLGKQCSHLLWVVMWTPEYSGKSPAQETPLVMERTNERGNERNTTPLPVQGLPDRHRATLTALSQQKEETATLHRRASARPDEELGLQWLCGDGYLSAPRPVTHPFSEGLCMCAHGSFSIQGAAVHLLCLSTHHSTCKGPECLVALTTVTAFICQVRSVGVP